jgi:SAM-dependent methyltransferase
MESKSLQQWLLNTFNNEELKLISDHYLNKIIQLIEVKDIQNYILECNKKSEFFKVAGQHRKDDWEKGWSGEGVYYSDDEYNNLPYYFKKNQYIRLDGKIFKDKKGFVEVDFLRSLQSVIFKSYLPQVDAMSIVEYGCGTGQNIEFLKKTLSKDYTYFGSDWAISAIKKLNENKILPKENIFQVNFFDPSSFIAPKEPYVAFSNASLEQAGDEYKEFMNFLFKDNLCRLGIHIEPIRELLDLTNPLNRQSFDYEKKRGYLKDFMKYLDKKDIDIMLAKDFGIGSSFLSGYQVVVWRPK